MDPGRKTWVFALQSKFSICVNGILTDNSINVSYATHEKETLESVIGARNPAPPKNAQDVMRDDNQFAEALSRFNVVVEHYPQLKADALYMNAMGSIEKYEENVRMSRMVFNDTVTKWNRLVKQIPSSFVAAIFGFSQRQYLETNQATANMPDLEF